MNNTLKILKNHSSIRKFNNIKISELEKSEIISSALRGATAGNMMLYSIIKISDAENLKFLSEKCDNQPFIEKASLALIFLIDTYKYYKFFEQRHIIDSNKSSKKAGVADFLLGAQDAMIAAQNSVIAAESMNIGTCYIGDILENKEVITKKFNLPKCVVPISMVVYGNYDTKPTLKDRFLEKHVVFDEVYPNIDDKFIDEMFLEKEKTDKYFGEKLYNRKMNSEFFLEMERSINKYLEDFK